MKVLMLAPDCQTIDRRILQEAAVLVDRGHQVTVLAGFECETDAVLRDGKTSIHRFAYPRSAAVASSLGRGLVDRLRLPGALDRAMLPLFRRLSRLTPFERFVVHKALSFEADVVHAHDMPMLRPALELGRRWGVPVVYDAHELYFAQEVLPPALRRRCFVEERQLIPRADAVITVNELLARRFAELYGIPKPRVVHNSVEPPPRELIEERGGPLREAFGGGTRIVLFQGWISAERNLETLLRAMAHVDDDVRLGIVGYGDHEAPLRELAQELGLGARVRFFGYVPAEEMLRWTVGADLGVIPYLPIDENHRLCSPNKLFEFVVSGVPVLAHDLPFLRLLSERHGVVHCGDLSSPERAAASLREALEPGRLAEMRDRCLRAAPRFSWAEDARILLEVYDRLAPGRAAAPS